ncbi:MAG: hypothetical protein KIT09_23385 [Bryobacteraceae bacterium]|nr:hypothetical protein [Bryobacteraceae bacterium]
MKYALLLLLPALASGADGQASLKVRVSWGHDVKQATPYYVKATPATAGVEVKDAAGYSLEAGESAAEGAWKTSAGAGDVDGVEFTVLYPEEAERKIQDLHIIWADLIAHSDADTANRLARDPAFRPNAAKVRVLLNAEGTRGFTFSVDQLLDEGALWIPSLGVLVASGEQPVSFADHQKRLTPWKGKRVLDQVRAGPEASYEEYTALWEDMGSPSYVHPSQPQPGHIVCVTWDSAIPKFGIDRGAGVWNDYGNPDRFRFWFGFGDLESGIARTWKSQRLADGLPVITTVFEDDGVRYEVEQFAYPLNGPPKERRGDIPMALLQKVKVTELRGEARRLPVTMVHRRQVARYVDSTILQGRQGKTALFRFASQNQVLLAVEGGDGDVAWSGVRDYQREQRRLNATVFLDLGARGSREFVVKLPSPVVSQEDEAKLVAIDYDAARKATVGFWSDYVARGAKFEVPEKVVNDLFRATLWHALRLPRRHGGEGDDVQIDLPYSNFAYSQTGTPWPVNQAVYVDYMLYDLRGYHKISAEELAAQYRNNQEANGHVSGFANWVVYTPGMMYAAAQNYLLSGDRAALDKLMPATLKSMDWTLDQIKAASRREGPTRGLVTGPLNDGTGTGVWSFNQAYVYAGLDILGRALDLVGNPRAGDALAAAREVKGSIAAGFGAGAARSPLVQLRDRTWAPYVPCEARTYGRILDQWYATDVDTGAVHMIRLQAVPPDGELADSLLNDHEDNLYYRGWGIANEPVYNQQGTAYLLRDEAKAAIRTFYSYMASAFSHSALEPVEHRWTHGQYFGPPSTDGAWFELYRNMLVREMDAGTLLLGQAAPRKWLEDGKKIAVERAPTHFGNLTYTVESSAASGKITARVELAARRAPQTLLVRLRHPESRPMQSVTVNGRNWTEFDRDKEWVRISSPSEARYEVVASY